jgi:hypothetical protein
MNLESGRSGGPLSIGLQNCPLVLPVCTENLKSDHSGDEVRLGWRVN